MVKMNDHTQIDGKSVLIFGGTGSLGRALIKRYRKCAEVHVFSRDEAKHWTLKNELGPGSDVRFHVGDVRDFERVTRVIREVNPWAVISAAALKHVDVCENAPSESIETNVRGPQNIANACWNKMQGGGGNIHVVLQVSTDKACEPVNVYGMCKALAERTFTSQTLANTMCKFRGKEPPFAGFPRFVTVRYGNVLESRGSILPLFRWQAENSNALTVTDPNMTRFVMTLDDSVDLITFAIEQAENGETWVPRLPAMRIGDLADLFSELYNKPVVRIPTRPGEKQHEVLVGKTEATRTLRMCNLTKHPDGRVVRYVINPPHAPAGRDKLFSPAGIEQYTSADDVMSPAALRTHLTSLGITTADMSTFTGMKIEEIRTR